MNLTALALTFGDPRWNDEPGMRESAPFLGHPLSRTLSPCGRVAKWLAPLLVFGPLLASPASAKLVCIVSHGPLTKEEQALLAEPEGTFREACEEAGYVVEDTPLAWVAYSKNLYNLAYMEQVMHGVAGLQGMAAGGKRFFKLEDLSARERAGIRAIFADSFVVNEAGPVLPKDGTTIALTARKQLTLTNGRKEITVQLPDEAAPPTGDFFADEPSKDERDRFDKDLRAKYTKQKYPDALAFHFRSQDATSALRTNTIVDVAKRLSDKLEAQRLAFTSVQNALKLSLMGNKLPNEGASWLDMDDQSQRFLRMMRDQRFQELGFASKEDADRFFFDARVKSLKVDGFVGVGIKPKDGPPAMLSASVNVRRN